LFGPPGTGKTYNTINKAVSIIDNLKEASLNIYYEERKGLKERFDELLIDDWENPNGQIGFITFHQNMSYEDFIEGIKPGVNDDQGVIYDIEPGIFKMIASIARDNWLDANKGSKEQLSFEEAFTKFKEEWQGNPEMKFPLKTRGYDYTILGFNKTSIRFKKASGGTGHTLSIATLRDYFYNRREIRQTGVGIYYPAILVKLKSYQPSLIVEKEEKNYVLIIDEINRGNVSQIFGELITLIEDNKRLGKDEALEVTLPYSKEKFGVPPNLHIIGTMNTADRSVESLDTALRRRFSFEEVQPKPELIATEGKLKDANGVLGAIELPLLLNIINRRIEKLLDKDRQIGHSFFISVANLAELQTVFQNKIIPLLQEYFFGDYGKLGLVLGEGFLESKEDLSENMFADFGDYDASEFAERTLYRIKSISNMTEDEFVNAIYLLLKK
jgi:5-methylcytosine-specific restriction protein B